MNPDFISRELPLWDNLIQTIFPQGVPSQAEWTDTETIVKVLNLIGTHDASNHTFIPSGGGLDLLWAVQSSEHGCVELSLDQIPHIMKVDSLTFHSFPGADGEWSYFRLNAGVLAPTGIYENVSYGHESVTEVEPRVYIAQGAEEYKGQRLPRSARDVVRHLYGDMVIFSKASTYNSINGTYDGRHGKVNDEQFRQYIKGAVDHLMSRR